MSISSFFSELEALLGIATAALPAIAAANTAANPGASNNGVSNTAALIAAVQPIVAAGEQLSAASATPLTGAQKLQNALAAVQVGVQVGAAAGVITQPEAAFLPIITSAINAAVAVKNAQAAQQPVPSPSPQPV